MCILSTLKGDSKLEMGDGKCPMDYLLLYYAMVK